MTRSSKSSCSSAAAASSAKKFDVFEFNEEDERIEKASERIVGKFSNPKKSRSSPITKYKFLQVFAQGPKSLYKDISSDPIDVDAEESKSSLEDVSSKPSEVGSSGIDHQFLHANSCSIDVSLQDNAAKEIHGSDGFLKRNSESRFQNEAHDIVSNDDSSSQISSSSTSDLSQAEIEDSFENQLVEQGSTAFEINQNGMKMVVNVFPDFILIGDIYSTRSRLIFSCSSMKLEGLTVNGSGETFKFEWPIDDIIKIESCWCGKVETAMINVLFKSKDSREDGNTNQNPGFKQLKFAVYDPCWFKAEEAVKSLDVRYSNIWNAIFDIDTDNYENLSEFGQNSNVPRYFPIFDEFFDEVVYPKGDPDAVSISKRDVELLQPETFINDTIIDFYIKYLKYKIPPEEQHRFHFFNSFFFRKLADLDKDPSCACDGRAAFQRVRKWTRKVNFFEKDYIFVPVNYSLHWSLIVICHPGEVTCFQDEEIEESSKVPCILHMDSLKGSHKGLKNVFQSYLCEEWKERHIDIVDDVSSKFLHLRFVSLELPQQEDLYDCGLFLLHYVELFLKEAPINFSPFKITKFSNFLNRNWFPPAEASLKRAHIEKLIYYIFQDNSQKAPPTDCIDKCPSLEEPDFIKLKMEADSFGGRCYPNMWHGHTSNYAKQGTDIQFPVASPTRVTSCIREAGLVFKDLQGTVVETSANCQQVASCHQRGFMSPIEEIQEAAEETAVSPLVMENSEVAVLASDFPSSSYFSKDVRASETSLQGFSMNLIETVKGHPSSRISTGVYWNTLETEAQEQPFEKIEGKLSDKTDTLECCSSSSEELAGCVVEDSQEENDVHDVDVDPNVKSPSSSFQWNVNPLTQKTDLSQNINLEDDDSASKREAVASASDEQDAKRRRLIAGGERRSTRGLLKENCLMSL